MMNGLKMLITMLGTFPSLILIIYVKTIIIPIVILGISIFILMKKNLKKLVAYPIIFHIFSVIVYFINYLNPSEKEEFTNLEQLPNYAFSSSIFAILAIVTAVIFIIRIYMISKKSNNAKTSDIEML